MDIDTLDFINSLGNIVLHKGWKAALDALFSALRKELVFDNLAIYYSESDNSAPEVLYARAVGRGRSAEADASWGDDTANQVLSTRSMVKEVPKKISDDRVSMPYVLGWPLILGRGKGALIFVRFGGPEYVPEHIRIAEAASVLVSHIIDRRVLRDLAKQLETARYRAQLQDDFIATISHDFHTPLGFIKGYATSLLRSDTTWDEKTRREFLSIIDDETDRLINLIDQLLDSARLKSGVLAMQFQPIRLDSIIRNVSMRVGNRFKSLKVKLDLDSSSIVQADAVRIAQVFNNLFDNAIKYAPGSNITISMHSAEECVSVFFADRGPGISPKHLPHLFERFYRVPDKEKRGTGLGLFICKEIIQAHGGQISVDTGPKKGTTFRIDLPLWSPGRGTNGLLK